MNKSLVPQDFVTVSVSSHKRLQKSHVPAEVHRNMTLFHYHSNHWVGKSIFMMRVNNSL